MQLTKVLAEQILVTFHSGKGLGATAEIVGIHSLTARKVLTGEVFKGVRPDLARVKKFGRGDKQPCSFQAEAIQLRKDGWTLAAIGKKFGRTRERIRQLTVDVVPITKPVRAVKTVSPERVAVVAQILELGQNEALSTSEVASLAGVTKASARAVLKGNSFKQVRPDLARRGPRKMKPEQIETYRLMLEDDLSLVEISKRVGRFVGPFVYPRYGLKNPKCPCCGQVQGSCLETCAVKIWRSKGSYRFHGRPVKNQ